MTKKEYLIVIDKAAKYEKITKEITDLQQIFMTCDKRTDFRLNIEATYGNGSDEISITYGRNSSTYFDIMELFRKRYDELLIEIDKL